MKSVHRLRAYFNLVGLFILRQVQFGGMAIPYWSEILDTAKRFHKFFYGIPSIGWDIAITPNGFVFTEIGEDWEIPVYQVTHGGLREKYYGSHGKALKVKLRKY